MDNLNDYFMQIALRLATRNLGQVWPNPAVGCVIIKDGRIISRGWTETGGRPHAETMALAQAGNNAKGATIYVTLEPCNHQGQTPPCTDALIKADIARAVIATGDPDLRVNGAGIARLKEAGIEVVDNILAEQARALNQGFLSRIEKQRPMIALKLATSLDGKIALGNGISQWITGDAARSYGHLLRSRYDAILTGINTALADDPVLNCRLPGMEQKSPVRIVMDRSLRLPLTSKLVQTASHHPLWIYTMSNDQNKIDALQSKQVKVFSLPQLTVENCAAHLAEQGITRLLVEAGQTLNTAFLKSDLVDKIHWFRARKIIGSDGLAAIGDLNHHNLALTSKFGLHKKLFLGQDQLEIYIAKMD